MGATMKWTRTYSAWTLAMTAPGSPDGFPLYKAIGFYADQKWARFDMMPLFTTKAACKRWCKLKGIKLGWLGRRGASARVQIVRVKVEVRA